MKLNTKFWVMIFWASFLTEGAYCDGGPFGVNRDGFDDDVEVFKGISDIGLTWVRLVAVWRTMEPVQGQIDFSYLDAQVAQAEARGLEIFLSFYFIPSWANGSDPECLPFLDDCSQPPTDPAFFRNFVSAVATRYQGRIAYYGIWNEPNERTFWDGDFQQYIDEILINGSVAIKAVDPEAKIVGPDTVFSPGAFAHAISDACLHLDVVSAHFYPGAVPGSANQMFSQIENDYLPTISSVCDRPLWITEFGLRSDLSSEQIQAEEYRSAYAGSLARSFLERMFIYRIEDHESPQPQRSGFLGRVNEGYPPKEAFFVVQGFIDEAISDRTLTIDESASGFLRLEGSGEEGFNPANSVVAGLPWGFSGCSAGNPCAATDNKWNAVNDAINGALQGLNAFASHSSFENVPETKITVAGLQDGLPFDVYVRFGLNPTEEHRWGLVVRRPGEALEVLDKNTVAKDVVRTWGDFQEWEVFIGRIEVVGGRLEVFIDDNGLDTAIWSGLRLVSAVSTPRSEGILFLDHFESANLAVWSDVVGEGSAP